MMKNHIAPQSPKSAAKFLKQLEAFPAALMYLCLGGGAKLPDHALKHILHKLPDDYADEPALPAILLIGELQHTLHEAVTESKTAKWNLVEAAHLNAASHMVEGLMDKMSSCEKILKTPVPWTYSRHTSRFLTLWLGTLPFALVGTLDRWLVIAVVAAASYCVLGIEEIGHLIEQPFVADTVSGENKVWGLVDESGNPSALVKRGQTSQPYDFGIPVCSLAAQIREEIKDIAAGKSYY